MAARLVVAGGIAAALGAAALVSRKRSKQGTIAEWLGVTLLSVLVA